MKQIAVVTCLLLIFAFTANSSQSYVTPLGGKLWQIKERIASQIERVKKAREDAENHMTLARLRVAEQLRMSEERLSMQLEKLKQYEEILQEQLHESGAALTAARTDWDSLVDSVASELQTQITSTNRLIEKMQSIREHVNNPSNSAILQFGQPFASSSVQQLPASTLNCPEDPIQNLQSLQALQAELDSISTSISSPGSASPAVTTPVPAISTGG